MPTINNFSGRYDFLSNFYLVDVYNYPSNEHFFMAMKSKDKGYREEIRNTPTPGQAKRLGRKVKLRPGWELMKDQVMYTGLVYKFHKHNDMGLRLMATHPATLIEGNRWHDQYWGDCNCPTHADTPGHNQLGELLMRVRAELLGVPF